MILNNLNKDDDLYLNMNKFAKKKNSNILFVTGQSGSGKSTLAAKLAKEYSAESIELDGFDDRGVHKGEHPFIYEYFTYYPMDDTQRNLERFEFAHAFDWLIKKCYQYPDRLFIINGVQIVDDLDDRVDWFSTKPMVIKGTNLTKIFLRKIKRGDFLDPQLIKYLIPHIQYTIQDNNEMDRFRYKILQ